MERMEKEGIVGPANHAGKREILLETAGGGVGDDDAEPSRDAVIEFATAARSRRSHDPLDAPNDHPRSRLATIAPAEPSPRSPASPRSMLAAASAAPAAAQNPFDCLFGRNPAPAPPPGAAPAPAPARAPPGRPALGRRSGQPPSRKPGDHAEASGQARPRPPLRPAAPPVRVRPSRRRRRRPPLRLRLPPSASGRSSSAPTPISTAVHARRRFRADRRRRAQAHRQALPAAPGQDPLRIRRARDPGGHRRRLARWRCATASSPPRTSIRSARRR